METARQLLQVGGAAQRTGLSTRGFTHLRGLKKPHFSLVRAGGRKFV
ncbi:hypothetical protein [Nostoc sp.]